MICWRIARCSHHETVALSLHTRHSLFTCFWRFAAVRYRNHRSSAFCTAEDGRRLKLGNLRSLAQLDVQGIHDREEVELLPGAKSGLRSGVTREECRSRKACSDSIPDLATAGTSQGTMSKHGSFGIVNRSAGWGDSWRWKGIDLISGQLRVEQTIYRGTTSSPKTQGSRRTLPLPQPILQTLLTLYERGLGKSDLDLVFSTSKGTPLSDTNLLHRELKPAGRNDRYSLARLAYAAANSCHVATSGGRFAQGCSSTVRTHETIHYARNLHRADSRTSAGGGRKPGAFGDEW